VAQKQVQDGAGELRIIAPNTTTVRILIAVLAFLTVLGALITFAYIARGTWTMASARVLGTGLILFVMGGLFLIFLWMWSANTRLLIGQGKVGYRNIVRRDHFWYRGEIARAIEMAVSYAWTSPANYGLYVFGLDGKRLLVLSSVAWHAEDLKDFVAAAGVQLERRGAPVKVKDARREFPNGFSWVAQHTFIAGCSAMLVATGLAIAGYALWSAVHK
jgi:hypothetical protein